MGRFSIEAIFKGNDQISKVIAGISGKVEKFSSGVGAGLKELNGVTERLAGGLASLAVKAAAGGAVIGAGLLHVVKTGADFEQAITNVGAVSGKSLDQIQSLQKAALSLGVTTQFSATEVANGMEMMARKGFTTEEILKGIPGVLNAVAASGQDMATVAGIVGSSIRGFGLDAGQASHVANVLAFASAKTGATITDLGSALATAAPTAKALGVSLEDTTAAVGLLQKIGIDAATSGSATATMLAKITKPSKEAATQMAAMGVKFKNAKGDLLPFNQVLAQFIKVGDKAGGSADRMAFFAELVGLRGDKAALGLADMAKAGDFQSLANDLKTVGDFAQRAADIRMDTTQGSWKLLTSTIEVLETKLFGLESGALRGVIKNTNAWVTANQDLIVSKVADFVKGIADNMPKIVLWGQRIVKIVGVFLAFAAAAKVASTAVNIALFVKENPYVALALAIIAAIALIVAFWPEIKAFFGRMWEHIKTGAAAVGGWFAELWTEVASAFMTVWEPIASFFSRMWNGIKAIVRGVLDFIVGMWTVEFMALVAVAAAVVEFMKPVWQPIVAFLSDLWETVKTDFQAAWDWVSGVAVMIVGELMAVWQPIGAFLGGIWNGVVAGFSAAWGLIVTVASSLVESLKSIWSPIATFFSDLWNGIADVFQRVVGGVIDSIMSAVNTVMGMVGKVQGIGHTVIDSATGAGDGGAGSGAQSFQSQVVSPMVNSTNVSSTVTNTAEITLRDATGRAVVSKPPTGGFSLNVASSGEF